MATPTPAPASTSAPSSEFRPGLEGVVAAETKLSHVDGQKGELIIAGYDVEEIAPNATFEEATYLLWHGERATVQQLAAFSKELAGLRALPDATVELLKAVAKEKKPVMDALRIAAGTLDLNVDAADQELVSKSLLARLPTVVAAYWRLRNGESPVAPRADLSHSANYLYMLTGHEADAAAVRGMETYLNTIIDHGLNASTFAARVIIATESDMTSAVVGAIGALKGPLHGGAPGPALEMVFEIGTAEAAEPYLRAKLERGERLMGFGHRVYKVRDPRAEVLGQAADAMFVEGERRKLYELAKFVEQKALALLKEYKPGRNLQTNVEFYTALLLHGLGLETELFTPTFACGRAAGWIAHCREQLATGRLIRPQSRYVGPHHGRWEQAA
ncbi:MAG: citrate synthase/methylcitrate synthase [Caldilineaceae bacterium]|nr:citrate synthase/methylcitrate synthase [Caldilineaceae bacterium]